MTKENSTVIDNFRREIKRQEEILLGLKLYFRVISLRWKNNKSVMETNKNSYKRIKERMERKINKAKKFLSKANKNNKLSWFYKKRIKWFKFPPSPSFGSNRFIALNKAYRELFSNKPNIDSLSDKDVREIQSLAIEKHFNEPS
ncbi:MAG: hypothetical protein ACQEP3_00620 [Patescibacteria group bacterium]